MNDSRMDLGMETKAVKFYPYRTALVRDIFMTCDRNTDTIQRFEAPMAKELGVHPDNHTAFKLESKCPIGTINIYVMCSDSEYWLGFSIEERRW